MKGLSSHHRFEFGAGRLGRRLDLISWKVLRSLVFDLEPQVSEWARF